MWFHCLKRSPLTPEGGTKRQNRKVKDLKYFIKMGFLFPLWGLGGFVFYSPFGGWGASYSIISFPTEKLS